jgi:hypothetical protein
MKLLRIELDGDELPSGIDAHLTCDEALYLTLLLGKVNYVQAEELMTGGGRAVAGLYECLTGALFNRFYDDGVNDAAFIHTRATEGTA